MKFNINKQILSNLVILLFLLIFINCTERHSEENFKRAYHTVVWTGREMIIWGGYDGKNYLNTGGRYNPESDTWLPVPGHSQ